MNIGMIGLDTSHVQALTRILHDETHPYYISGHRVIAGYPGISPEIAPSRDRVATYTQFLIEEEGAKLCQTPEEVAEMSDFVFITAVDGRQHREYFDKVAFARKPVFVDKPFTCSTEDARAILATAEKYNIPLITASSLRYAESFVQALRHSGSDEAITGSQFYGPMGVIGQIPHYFWYGVHCAEMLVATMGVGCRQVTAFSRDDHELLVAEYTDGRIATLRGARDRCRGFGGTIFRENGATSFEVSENDKPYYVSLIEAILAVPEAKQGPQTAAEILEVVRFLEAATESRSQNGKPVLLFP